MHRDVQAPVTGSGSGDGFDFDGVTFPALITGIFALELMTTKPSSTSLSGEESSEAENFSIRYSNHALHCKEKFERRGPSEIRTRPEDWMEGRARNRRRRA